MNKFEADWNEAVKYGKHFLPERGQEATVNLTIIQLAEFVRFIECRERDKCTDVAWRERAEGLARTVMADMGNAREPLTTRQIDELVHDVYLNYKDTQPTPETVVRAIERAHGIGLN